MVIGPTAYVVYHISVTGVQFVRQKEIFKKEKKIFKKSRSHRIKEPSLWSLGGPTGDCPLPVVISRGFMIYYTYRGGGHS